MSDFATGGFGIIYGVLLLSLIALSGCRQEKVPHQKIDISKRKETSLKAPKLETIDLLALQNYFNANKGKTRIVELLSPNDPTRIRIGSPIDSRPIFIQLDNS